MSPASNTNSTATAQPLARSPGYAITLVAETTTGCALAAQATGLPGKTPEEIGQQAAIALLQEIANVSVENPYLTSSQRGCVDTAHQSLVLLLMVLCPDSVSQVRLGKLTPYTYLW